MLAEIGCNQSERRPVFRSASDADRKTQRNRCRAGVARNDFNAGSRRQCRMFKASLFAGPARKYRKVGVYFFGKFFRIAACESDDHIRSGVVIAIEAPHVVERQFFKSADLAGIVMAVGMTSVDNVVQLFLTELLIIALTQRNFQKVDGVVSYAFEIFRAKARLEQYLFEQRIVAIEIFNMCRPGKYRHFFIDLYIYRRRHWIQRLNDLVIAHRARAAPRKHGRRKRGESLLAWRIEGRAGQE